MESLLTAGLIALCGMVELEVLLGARDAAEHKRLRAKLEVACEWLLIEDLDFRRAIEVQGVLARTGRHRAVSLPDLILAAVAERHRVAVLHYDVDFELIAEITGQPMQWVVPRGSIKEKP